MPAAAAPDYAKRAAAKRRRAQSLVVLAGGLVLANIQPVIA